MEVKLLNSTTDKKFKTGERIIIEYRGLKDSDNFNLDFDLPEGVRAYSASGAEITNTSDNKVTLSGDRIYKDGWGQIALVVKYEYEKDGESHEKNPPNNNNMISLPLEGDSFNEGRWQMADGRSKKERSSLAVAPENPLPSFDYADALDKSFLFYDAQKTGVLPDDHPIEWREDSGLLDGDDFKGKHVDLTGGYFIDGDTPKFGLPMAVNSTTLAWSGIEYEQAYRDSGQWNELLDKVKWGTDYFLKAHIIGEDGKTERFYVQVGDARIEHKIWDSPENITNRDRPAYYVDRNAPGSDVTAATATALASASLLFREVDPDYSQKLLTNAKALYEFANSYRGKYSDSVPAASPYYASYSGDADELAEAGSWLYRATGEQKYLDDAEKIYGSEVFAGDWSLITDNRSVASTLLLAQDTGKDVYKDKFNAIASDWVNGTGNVTLTEGGLAWRVPWGSNTMALGMAFAMELYNDEIAPNESYSDFAESQVNYVLGDNPRNSSYVIGFGENYPTQPHHRGASGDAPYGQASEHILYGALVGGIESPNDFDYHDDRGNWISNEVGLGYNSNLTATLIQQVENF